MSTLTKLGTALVLSVLATRVSTQITVSLNNFEAVFAADSAVLQSLKPKSNTDFDFSPSDLFTRRNGDGEHHTGDITIRFRTEGAADWISDDSAAVRQPVDVISSPDSGPPTCDLGPTLPQVNSSMKVIRSWHDMDGDLVLNFTITNIQDAPIEIGSLGFPIEFNSIFTPYTGEEVTDKCVLIDPYIGLDAGYLQVTRLNGIGPNLVVTPLSRATKFEAWRFLPEPNTGDLGYDSNPFEGFYEWQVFSQAWAEKEWQGAEQWNPPTSVIIKPGESQSYSLRMSIASTIPEVETSVASAGLPYVVGVPGYVIPSDLNARLFVNSVQSIRDIQVVPEGAVALTTVTDGTTLPSPWSEYSVKASQSAFGRVRVTISFEDGRQQSIHYFITFPGPDAVAALGQSLFSLSHYTDISDPFLRAPSIITYDYEAKQPVLQDHRVWIAGLSDDAGAGSFLAAAMKQAFFPSRTEIQALDEFVNSTLWANLQVPDGDDMYAVRKSLFYYDKSAMPDYPYDPNVGYGGWESWNKQAAFDAIDRGYNYVHVSAVHWALYRVARNYANLTTSEDWMWYLDHAWNTVKFCLGSSKTSYEDLGLMGETVWGLILEDLKREGWLSQYDELASLLRKRQSVWSSRPNPYGSEQAWDSTGQEGVYYWSQYFQDQTTADKTLASIRGFDPTVAHWAYNGNARRYWDFGTAGKISRNERIGHHYGSALNALPLLENLNQIYISSPQLQLDGQNFHDLRIGSGGIMAPLSNINAEGFGSMGFHLGTDLLKWDAYSGDYGLGFSGHVMGTATYLGQHPTFGWLAFGGNVVEQDGKVVVEPKDSLHKRVLVAPAGLLVVIESGAIKQVSFDPKSGETVITLISRLHEAALEAQDVLVTYSSTASRIVEEGVTASRGGYVVSFNGQPEVTVRFEKV